jgi:hypothetical protein
MNFLGKISLAAAAVAALGGVMYWDEYSTKKEEEQKSAQSKALTFEISQVRKLSLENESGKFVFERENATSDWKMLEPKAIRPDQDAVNNVLSSIQSLTVNSELKETEKFTQGTEAAKYGLEKPRIAFDLTLEGNKTKKLHIGSDLGLGTKSGEKLNAISVYAFNPERKNLLVVGSTVVSAGKKTFADFRTRQVTDFKAAEAEKLVLTKNTGEKIEVTKADGKWKVKLPRELEADENNMSLFLDRLSNLKAEKVTEQTEATPEKLATMNLVTPNAVIEIIGKENKVIQSVKLGLTPQNIFVTMIDGAVGSLDVNKWTELSPELKYFRDRRVMRGLTMSEISKIKTKSGRTFQKEGAQWYLTEETASADPKNPAAPAAKASPVVAEKTSDSVAATFFSDWEFMTADDIIDGPEAQDLAKFGLDKPVTKFLFEFSEASKGVEEVFIGNRVPKNEKTVYVKRSSRPEIFAVETSWLDALSKMDGAGKSPQAQK